MVECEIVIHAESRRTESGRADESRLAVRVDESRLAVRVGRYESAV